MKEIFKIIAVTSAILLVGSILIHQNCPKKVGVPQTENEFQLPEETFRPAIIKIPFKKSVRMPVAKRQLPIPIKDITKTITIGEGVVIVIDKKGDIYTTKDTPKDIPIKVTVWKPKALAFESEWGATLAMTLEQKPYICVSWSFLRIGKAYIGVDAGVRTTAVDDLFLGIAGRIKILKKNEIYGTLGYEFTHKTVYLGITIIF